MSGDAEPHEQITEIEATCILRACTVEDWPLLCGGGHKRALEPCKLQAMLHHIVLLCAASLGRVGAVTIAVSHRGYGAGWFAADMIRTC